MSKVERNVVKPPNQEYPGDRRSNAYLPLAGAPGGDIYPANGTSPGDRISGSMPIIFETSAVKLPDHRFHVADAETPKLDCMVAPGHGAVPVEALKAFTGIVDDVQFVKSARPNKA